MQRENIVESIGKKYQSDNKLKTTPLLI